MHAGRCGRARAAAAMGLPVEQRESRERERKAGRQADRQREEGRKAARSHSLPPRMKWGPVAPASNETGHRTRRPVLVEICRFRAFLLTYVDCPAEIPGAADSGFNEKFICVKGLNEKDVSVDARWRVRARGERAFIWQARSCLCAWS